MSRAFRLNVLTILGLVLSLPASASRTQAEQSPTDPPPIPEDSRIAEKFFNQLRERKYYDLAADYLETLKGQTDAPDDLVTAFDYEIGRLRLDEATVTGDMISRRDLLDQARIRLDAFVKSHPDHAKAPDANIQLARLLVERGHMAMVQANETEDAKEKDAKIVEARETYDQARVLYQAAQESTQKAFDKFPKFLPESDPRHKVREETHNALRQAQLQKAVVEYEKGETYPPNSAQRIELLTAAGTEFEALFNRYREQWAGISARMWQGKCYEERGDLGKAMGIYKELMQHSDPRLIGLQRYVGYFQIIIHGKQKNYPLGVAEAERWLKENDSKDVLRSLPGLGVQFEEAKDLIEQAGPDQPDREKNIKRAVDRLRNVVRTPSKFKPEALALLKKYKPKSAANAAEIGKMDFDNASTEAENAIAAQEWTLAAAYLHQALRQAERLKDVDKMNNCRFNLATVEYNAKHYYESAVLAEHVAFRSPRSSTSAGKSGEDTPTKASMIALASYSQAYNANASVDRLADLKMLIQTAKAIIEAFPTSQEGDRAKLALGQIYQGSGDYPQAITYYNLVRPRTSQWLEAKTRLGSTYWDQSLMFKRDGKTTDANTAITKAVEVLEEALKTRKDAGTPDSDPELVDNVCDLADIDLSQGNTQAAINRLEPLVKSNPPSSDAHFARLTSTLLRARIGANQVVQAIADMQTLEKVGGDQNLTQLYFSLGRLLEREIESLKKKGEKGQVAKIQDAYQKFLVQLQNSKTNQSFESLLWAGESLLKLGKAAEANKVFLDVIKTYSTNQTFMARADAKDLLLRARLKLAASYRGLGNFNEAQTLIDTLVKESPKAIEPLMERGMLVEDRAFAKKAEWSEAADQWKKIANRMANVRVKPTAYYEAWYHAALAMNNAKKPKEAKQMLAGIMRLSAGVGGPEMKQKYKDFMDQIK